jgi:hypothetical protein
MNCSTALGRMMDHVCVLILNELLMGTYWIKLFALLIALLFLSRCACLLDRFWLWKNDILFLNPTRWLLHLKSGICSRGLLGPVDFSSNLANAIMSEPDHWNCLHVHSSAWIHGYSSVSVPMVAAVGFNCIVLCKITIQTNLFSTVQYYLRLAF